MSSETATLLMLTTYAVVCTVLLTKVWRRDPYFAVFFSMMVLYSAISQIGYFLFPELSIVMLRMYFGPEILPEAIAFTVMSLLAMYLGFRTIYQYAGRLSIPVYTTKPDLSAYKFICVVQLVLLALGLSAYYSDLSYANAADVNFIESAGLPYKLFWNLFKFTTFTLLVLYGIVRFGAPRASRELPMLRAMLVVMFIIFVIIASATGNRTDPLAVVLGCLGIEYFARQQGLISAAAVTIGPTANSPSARKRRRRERIQRVIVIAAVLSVAVGALTLLEESRGVRTSDDSLEASALTQAILLKDYYTPYHVLLGVMANDYVSPQTVLTSNAANALMFLKVDFLQTFAVDLWDPGTATRAASPALFAFAEGYMFMGWAGFIYNGFVFSLGLAVWRTICRTENPGFNAVAAGLTLAMAATVARSQSSYFVKDIYLWFAPALLLYGLACGCYPRLLSIGWTFKNTAIRSASGAQR